MFDLQPAPVCCSDVRASLCVCAFAVYVSSFACVWCACTCVFCLCDSWYICIKERREEPKKTPQKNNQSGSSLGPVTKVIQRFYQWAKVPVAMETLMNEKGPSNRGDGVNEELPHRPDTVCDGGCCLETEIFISCHHHCHRRLCYHHHLHHRQCCYYFHSHITEIYYIT